MLCRNTKIEDEETCYLMRYEYLIHCIGQNSPCKPAHAHDELHTSDIFIEWFVINVLCQFVPYEGLWLQALHLLRRLVATPISKSC